MYSSRFMALCYYFQSLWAQLMPHICIFVDVYYLHVKIYALVSIFCVPLSAVDRRFSSPRIRVTDDIFSIVYRLQKLKS